MKAKITSLLILFVFGITVSSFAGNHPALTYPAGKWATAGNVAPEKTALPGKTGPLHYATGVVAATGAWYSTCPVLKNPINSKHEAMITLTNGKSMMVCCAPCKKNAEKSLGKYKMFMF